MAEQKSQYSGLLGWVDARMPTVMSEFKKHASEYYAPKNFNFWYIFGGIAIVVLVLQILTGIFLTMHYKPDANLAFASVEYIMRDVPGGWFIRYMHSTGASFFFIVVYLHMFRALLYGSYRNPRELIWIFGCLIFLMLMAEAFFGYLLPWGQMSYWGAQVIVNLFGAIPLIGPELAILIRGDFVVGDATLSRFFAFHVIAIPLLLLGLVVAHIIALHDVGSNNPDGIEIKAHKDAQGRPLDGVPFHPYYTVHDLLLAVDIFDSVFRGCVFLARVRRIFPRVEQLHPRGSVARAHTHRAALVLHAVLLDPARDDRSIHVRPCVRNDQPRGAGDTGSLQFDRARRGNGWSDRLGDRLLHARPEILGRRTDGRLGHDLLCAALARSFAGAVNALPPGVAFRAVDRVGRGVSDPRLSRHSTADTPEHRHRSGVDFPVLRILCVDAVVEPDGNFQAGTRAHYVGGALRCT